MDTNILARIFKTLDRKTEVWNTESFIFLAKHKYKNIALVIFLP